MSWKQLEDFYNQDCRSANHMAPKLTEKHIHLPPFTNMRVKLATQDFSHSVAAGMHHVISKTEQNKLQLLNSCLNFILNTGIQTMEHQQKLLTEATRTARFLEEMDRLKVLTYFHHLTWVYFNLKGLEKYHHARVELFLV